MKPISTHTAPVDGMAAAAAVLQFSTQKTASVAEFAPASLTTTCIQTVHINYKTQLTSFNRAKAEEVGWRKDGGRTADSYFEMSLPSSLLAAD